MVQGKINKRNSFEVRLRAAVEASGIRVSPTSLTREFNLRWRGQPVSIPAVRKWLCGEGVPTLDKLTVLAQLLNTTVEWLKWGVGPEVAHEASNGEDGNGTNGSLNGAVLQDFDLLTPENKVVVRDLIQLMLKRQKLDETE